MPSASAFLAEAEPGAQRHGDFLGAAVAQVEQMRVALAAIADDGDLLALDEIEIGVPIVINAHNDKSSSVSDAFSRDERARGARAEPIGRAFRERRRLDQACGLAELELFGGKKPVTGASLRLRRPRIVGRGGWQHHHIAARRPQFRPGAGGFFGGRGYGRRLAPVRGRRSRRRRGSPSAAACDGRRRRGGGSTAVRRSSGVFQT